RRALALGAGARVLLEVVAAAGAPDRGDRLHRPGRMHGGGVRDPSSARARERRRRASARPRGRRWVDAPLRLRAGDDHADAGRSAGRRIGVARAPAALTRGADLVRGFVVSPRWRRKRPGAPGATGMLMYLLPRALSALLILVVGWLAANFLGQAVLIAAVNASLPEARLLARAARWLVLLFAFATALTEIGIGRDMVLVA